MSAFEGRADMPQAWRDVRLWPRLCENGSARRSGARLIQTECRWRMKDSPRRQVRFFCCVLTTVGSVFTQPRPKADNRTVEYVTASTWRRQYAMAKWNKSVRLQLYS